MSSDESGAVALEFSMSRYTLTSVTNLDLILYHMMQNQLFFGQW
jgi:hypothetical protein